MEIRECPCGWEEHTGVDEYHVCGDCENTGKVTEGMYDDVREEDCLCVVESKADDEADDEADNRINE